MRSSLFEATNTTQPAPAAGVRVDAQVQVRAPGIGLAHTVVHGVFAVGKTRFDLKAAARSSAVPHAAAILRHCCASFVPGRRRRGCSAGPMERDIFFNLIIPFRAVYFYAVAQANDSPLNHRLFFGRNLYVCVQEKLRGGVYLQFIHVYIDILAKMAYYLCIALNAKSTFG